MSLLLVVLVFASTTLISPSIAAAANNDPFRGGREAVNPKQSAGVGESTGAMTYSYPLAIPPGRNGVQPNLSLNYSSDDKRQDSPFGYGWSMSLPYIERVNKLGTNNLYNQDSAHTFFTSSLSGDLLPFVNANPIGGSFLGVSESTPLFAYLDMPPEVALFGSSSETSSAPAPSPTSVSDQVARSFHTFSDTFLPIHVYHPNEWALWNAARAQASRDAKAAVPGFPAAQEDLQKNSDGPIIQSEIISARTATSKKFLVEQGNKEHISYHVFQSPIHFKNPATGQYEDIDTTLVDGGNEFVMNKAGYQVHLSKSGSAADALISFSHDGQTLLITSPAESGSRNSVKRPDNELPSSLREKGLVYPAYFGSQIDLLVTTRSQALEKDIIIRSASAFGDLSGKEYVEVPFEITSPQALSLTVNGHVLSKNTSAVSSLMTTITSGSGVNTYIFPPAIVDSANNVQSIDIEYTKTSTGFRMTKRIPVSFLTNAVYPVKADATFSITVAAGDGYVRHSATTWSSTHDAVSGTNAVSWTGPTMRADSVYDPAGGGHYYISRSFLPFDTSSVDDSATIASSTLYLTPDSRTVADSVSRNYIVVVGPTTQAATNSLASSDYSKCGATTSPTEYSSHYSYSQSWPVGTAVPFTLNSSGTSSISKTGYTYLGLRSGFDVENSAPSGNNVWTVNTYDYGSGMPYLDIETVNTDSPTGLQVELLTNPSNVATSNPRFSAVYANASSSALASYYQIQISTTASFASVLYWDSGKISLSSTTPLNQRTPQIFSTTTFATNGTTYHWRIRFWDQYNTLNSWSVSGDYFITQVAGEYMPRVDDGSMMRYTLNADGSWTAYDKRGWKYTFGATSNARISDPSDSAKIYRWYLEELADPNGNKVLYRYTKDGGQVYPDYIDYTDHGAGDSPFEVDFVRCTEDGHYTCLLTSASWATSSIYGFSILTKDRIGDISVKVGGNVVRRITPTYVAGDNGARPLLSSLQEVGGQSSDSGTKSADAITFPPTSFSYQKSTTTWTQVADVNSWQVGFDVSDTSNDDMGWRLFDINGDALPDWFRSDGGTQTILLNTGSKWSTSTAWSSPVSFASGNLDQGVRMGDVNGDGLIDIIAASSSKVVYLNNGTSTWVASTTWSFPESFIDSGNRDQGVQLVDVNGDGLADVFRSHFASTTGTTSKVYINNGHGWTEDTGWSIPEVLVNNLKDSAVRLYDYNGDGLVDIVFSPYPNSGAGGQPTRIYYNTGRGWQIDSAVSVPLEFSEITAPIDSADRGIRFADFNGDGCVDIAQGLTSITKRIYLSNCSTGYDSLVTDTLPEYFRDTVSDYGVRMEDIDGDGQLDMIRSFYDTGGGAHTHKVYLKNGNPPDVLSEVMSPRKGRTTVGYKGSAEYQDGGGNLMNPNLPLVTQTVRTLTTDNGSYMGTQRVIATTTYDYQRGYFYGTSSDPLLRHFSGFGLVTATNSASAVTRTYFHQGNGSDAANGEFADDISKAGKPYRTETTDQYGNLFTRTINKWARADYGDGRNFVKLAQTLSQTFDGDSSHRDTAASTTYNNATGDISVLVNYGEVTGNSDGTFTDIGTDLASTTYTYAASSTNSTVSYPSRELLADQSGGTVKDTKWTYDGLSFGSVTYGNPTKEEHLISGSRYASTTKVYDSAYGLVATSTDPLGNATGYTYDGYNLFPTTVRNALGQQRLFSYDYSLGKAATTTDENNQTVVTVLDNLDRPIQEKQPDFTNPSTLVFAKTYAYTDATTTPSSVLTKTYLNSATTTDSYSYVDGFDRPVQAKREAESANGWITKDTFYNSIGAVGQESLPYFATTSAYTVPTTTPALFVTNTYDPVGRVLSTANVVGTTTNLYSDWRLTVTDALGNKKEMVKDAYGNLGSVIEYLTAGSPATTTYTWNLLGKLTKLTDAISSVRNFTYDNLGRLIGSEDLHVSGDAAYGTTSRQYDDGSNLIQLYSPRGIATTYTYDSLNRVTKEDATTTTTGLADVIYHYDSCTNGKGRVCQVNANNAATTTYEYNPIGLVGTTSRKIGSVLATTTSLFYWNGAQDTLVYPTKHQVRYVYNDAGDLNKVYGLSPGTTTWSALIESTNYGPTGQPIVVDYGNNTKTTYAYDASKLYRLTRKLTVATSTNPSITERLQFLGVMMKLGAFRKFALLDEPMSSFAQTASTSTDLLPINEGGTSAHTSVVDADTNSDANLDVATLVSPIDVASAVEIVDALTPAPVDDSHEKSNGEVALEEVRDMRTATSKTYLNGKTATGDNQYLNRIYAGDIHYLDVQTKKYEDIDATFRTTDDGAGWEITKAPYVAYILKDNAGAIDFSQNGISLTISPVLSTKEPISKLPVVLGEVGHNVIGYKDIIQPGVDLELSAGNTSIRKDVVIENKEAITGNGDFFDVSFALSSQNPIDLSVDGKILAEEEITTSKEAHIFSGNTTVAYIWSPIAEAANGETAPIMITYKKEGSVIWLTKHIPRVWLEKATYPVRADAVLSVKPVSGDGYVESSNAVWSTAHDASSGTYVNYAFNKFNVASGHNTSSNKYWTDRPFIPFNTSGLTAEANISSSTLHLKTYILTDNDNDGDDWITVVQTSQASTTSLVFDDYDQCGAITNPTEGINSIERKDITGLATSTWYAFSLNSTGQTWINKTGVTQLGLREGHDAINSAIVGGAITSNEIRFFSTEFSGSEPYLDIVYSIPNIATSILQDLRYSYDSIGNITQIIDLSGTNSAASTSYQYDNLYRLTRASSTDAVTTNWLQTYTYDALGNITNKSDVGNYTYAGTGFANPDAPTQVGAVTYTYDNAGNVTNIASQAFTWNYANRLTDVSNSGTSTHYAYDQSGMRVQQDINRGSGTTSTRYFGKTFEVTGATTTLYIFLPNGELLATVEGNGAATSTYIAHTDHLGSVQVMSDKNGSSTQVSSYLPFGSKRLNELPSNGFVEKRGFIQQYEDTAVQLSYLQQRYYDATRGQFMSQDPLVKQIGLEIKGIEQLLLDPQMQNYYSYARNNPINYSDPNGEAATMAQLLSQISALLTQLSTQLNTQYTQYSSGVKQGVDHPIDSAKAIATGNSQSTAQTIGMTVGVTAQAINTGGAIYGGYGMLKMGAKALMGGATEAAVQSKKIFDARTITRMGEDPGPNHNFPMSFMDDIFTNGEKTVTPDFWRTPKSGLSDTGIMYKLPGELNGQQGMYEIGTRPSISGNIEVISHYFFRPAGSW